MSSRRVFINAILSVFQVLFLGISYFVVFRIILDSLGESALGIWSLVSSISSVANVANLGVSDSLVKFVASYHKNGEENRIVDVLSTGLIVVLCTMTGLLLILYTFGGFVLAHVVPVDQLSDASTLLPFSLIALWLNTISGVYLSVLDGMLLTFYRNIIYITSSAIFCLLAFLVVDHYGLVGVAIAQITQVFCIIIIANIVITKKVPSYKFYRLKWSKSLFKEVFSYSVNFQLNTIIRLFIDPITKFFLAKFGTLGEVGFYEMANRLVVQVRQLVTTANQVYYPVIAQKSGVRQDVIDLYRVVYRIVIGISLPLMSILILWSPIISLIWIGKIEMFFLVSVFIISLAYTININSGQAYFSCLGTGNLKIITTINVFYAISNIFFSFSLGLLFQGIGVVIGTNISMGITSYLLIFLFRKKFDIPLSSIQTKDFKLIVGSYIIIILLYLISFNLFIDSIKKAPLIFTTVAFIFSCLLFLIVNYKNSIYNEIIIIFKTKTLPK